MMAGGAPMYDSDFPKNRSCSRIPRRSAGGRWTIRNRDAKQGGNWVWKEKQRSDSYSSDSGRLKYAPLGSDGDGYISSKEMSSKVFELSATNHGEAEIAEEKVFCPEKLGMLARIEDMLASISRSEEELDEWIEVMDMAEKRHLEELERQRLEIEREKRERDMLEREMALDMGLERERVRDMEMSMVTDMERMRARDLEMEMEMVNEVMKTGGGGRFL